MGPQVNTRKHVCWDCRRVSTGITCPDCHQPMVDMGTRWRPPRRSQDHKWKQQHDRWLRNVAHDGTDHRQEQAERRRQLAATGHIANRRTKPTPWPNPPRGKMAKLIAKMDAAFGIPQDRI